MAQIVASLFAESREQTLRAASKAAMAGADWLELRLDRWPRNQDLVPLFSGLRLPALVACRTPEDGGQFRGTLAERRELLAAALDAGAQGIDLEGWESWAPPAGKTRVRLRIRSFHSFTGVPKELAEIRDKLHAHPGQIAKIVVTAHDLADAAPVVDLLAHTDQRTQPTVAFAMGRTAWPTRILAAAQGAPLVYGRVDDADEETAPGQPPVALLRGLFRAHELSPATQVFGLLGNPALQSLGPWLHNRAFRRCGLDAVYLPFETSHPEAAVAMLRRCGLRGLSVTAPHKGVMASRCRQLDADAQQADAVNTVLFDDAGGALGANTDVAAVVGALGTAGVVAGDGHKAAVLGAGGAARAGALALLRLGFRVTMLARSLEPARAFAAARGVQLASLSEQVLDELQPAVVVHATPVGSVGRDPEERLVPGWKPKAGCVVLDMVYQPRRTRLLRDAAACGAKTVEGLAMFLCQAAAQSRLFTGKGLPPDQLAAFLAGAPALATD
jgi:3-dehydroquinate dehydratase/shikimate dehydrogenase